MEKILWHSTWMRLPIGDPVPQAIRDELARIGMTQQQLAQLLGERDNWLSRRLNRQTRITVDDLERISDALGWSPAEVLEQAN